MKVTFIVKLMVEILKVLTSEGFEIDDTNVTEKRIDILTFRRDDDEYSVSISTVDDASRGECLRISGTMVRANLCRTGYQITEILKNLKFPDHITVGTTAIRRDEYSVKMTKFYESKFDLKGVDKTALRAIALDILGGIIAL